MRKKVKVVGLGQRKTGTSNGRNYDFVPVSFVYSDEYVNGLRAAHANIDSSMLNDFGGIKLNDEIDMIFHFVKNQIYVDGIV